MSLKLSRLFLANTCAALALLTVGCSVSAPTTDVKPEALAATSAPKMVSLDFKKGQVLSFTVIDSKDGAAATAARDEYYDKAFPLAETFGLSRDMGFKVVAVPVGALKPQAVALFSWPNASAEEGFSAHPDWPAIKSLRPEAWDELRIYNDVLKQDMNLTFDSSKTYTLAAAWINPKYPDDYEKYLSGIQTAVKQSGGRFIYKMHNPSFEAHAAPQGAPDQVLMVEWDTAEGLQKFGKSAGFKANAKYLGSGTRLFELAVLSPVVG